MSDSDKKGKLRPLRPDTQPVSAVSLPLPSGAATSAKQDDIKTEINKTVRMGVPEHDFRSYTYVAAGNGLGKLETITYKVGGSGGTTVAVITITYNASNNQATVTKTIV